MDIGTAVVIVGNHRTGERGVVKEVETKYDRTVICVELDNAGEAWFMADEVARIPQAD